MKTIKARLDFFNKYSSQFFVVNYEQKVIIFLLIFFVIIILFSIDISLFTFGKFWEEQIMEQRRRRKSDVVFVARARSSKKDKEKKQSQKKWFNKKAGTCWIFIPNCFFVLGLININQEKQIQYLSMSQYFNLEEPSFNPR